MITLLPTVNKRLHKVVLSTFCYLTISLSFALGKSRELKKQPQADLFSFTYILLDEKLLMRVKKYCIPKLQKFRDVNSAYSDLANKITQVINNPAPYKTIRVKISPTNGFIISLLNKYLIGTSYLKSSNI